MNQITLGSLFDGSGGFTLGAIESGIIPVWASEIGVATWKQLNQTKKI